MNGFPSNAAQSVDRAPRDIGVLARIDNIAANLAELHLKLAGFGQRLSGGPSKEEGGHGHPLGISSALSAAEARLRDCHEVVDALHKAF